MSLLTGWIYTEKTRSLGIESQHPKFTDKENKQELSKRLRWSSQLDRKKSQEFGILVVNLRVFQEHANMLFV